MRSYLRRSSIATLVIGLTFGLGLLLIPEATMSVLDVPLDPWFDLCRYVTPQEWQTMGNITMAMLWLFSGVAALSIVSGVVIGACIRPKSRAPKPASTPHG